MSENHDSKQVLEGFGAVENGEINNYESGVPDTVNQEPSSLQEHHVDHGNGVLVTRGNSVANGPSDVVATEDGGKEDTFVDCPDELILSDNREAMVMPETQQSLEEKDDMQKSPFHESDNGTQVHDLRAELVHLQAMLEKTIHEKEGSAQEYKEERDAFVKEIANLHHQLKVLNGQLPLLNENDGGLVDGIHNAEMGEVGEKISASDDPLYDMMNECSKFVSNALDARLQNEGTCRELHAMLFLKDQEIDDLRAKVQDEQHQIESITNRVLGSLALAVNEEELLDDSITGKMSHVEKNSSLLIEKYNNFLSEIDLLRQCLTEFSSDFNVQNGFETTFLGARDVLLELKRKEVNLAQKISDLEDENKKLVEQLDKGKEMEEMENAAIERLRVELEQEKVKYANTKEKLSMAVTKGKALVQQRDSLKQSVAEKTNELEKCLNELQEKSRALEAAEINKEELVRTENLVASLQQSLSGRDTILSKCEQLLSETTAPQEIQSADIMERIRWLVDERTTLTGVTLKFQKLIDVLTSIDFPEHVSLSDPESQVSWLVESFSQVKGEVDKLQDEIARTSEGAQNEIERLTTSLLTAAQEKNYLQEELDDLTLKYKEIAAQQYQLSLEKDQMVTMLLEASGITRDNQEEADQPPSNLAMLVDRCFNKVKNQSSPSFEYSGLDAEMFERIQTHLYLKDQELMLCEKLLEEDMLIRSNVNTLLDELRIASEELHALKDEKSILQKDLERSDEKSALLREKLSMAVKKGKGLVQERENLKKLLDEKTTEIEKLKLELQQQESALGDCKDQISKLSTNVEVIPKLESDLTTMKDSKDQLEQFLVESNNILQRVFESIDGIVLPVDLTFKEPVEKLQWLTGYINECQVAKIHVEQELEKVKVEASSLSSKLAEAYADQKALEEAVSIAENNISRLAEEKRELEVGKTDVEQELQKTLEASSSQAGKFAEVSATRKSLEDALSEAENKISILVNEKEDARASRASAEMELEKVKEEVSIQTTNLEEAHGTINSLEDALSHLETTRKSLEDALSEAENKISILVNEKEEARASRAAAEMELEKVEEEVSIQTTNLEEAHGTIKSLEDALSHLGTARKSLEDALSEAENKISILGNEKEEARASRAAAEMELEKVKEEVSIQTANLAEAYGTIKSLQDSLSQVETDVSFLSKENNNTQVGRTNLENEMNKLKEEADSQVSKFADACLTIKSLEDALSKAEHNVSELVGEKENAEEQISALNSKLNACMEELSRTSSISESRSLELSSHLNSLQLLLKDETLLSLLRRSFEIKFESLKEMDLLLNDINNHFVEMGSETLQSYPVTEVDSFVSKFSAGLYSTACAEMNNVEGNSEGCDNFEFYFKKTVEGFHVRNQILADKFQGFSTFTDELITVLLTKLQATRDELVIKLEQMRSLKQQVNSLEMDRQVQENKISMLENDITILESASTDAARELEIEVENNLVEPSSVPELEKLNFSDVREVSGDAVAEHQQLGSNKFVKTAHNLLASARKVRVLTKQFENARNVSVTAIKDLENKLTESNINLENAIGERDLNQNSLSKLESDFEALQNSYQEMQFKLENYQAKEDKLNDREAEISSLKNTLLMKEKEAEDTFLSASQVKFLYDKINDIKVPFAEFKVGDTEYHDSDHANKLFYIIDAVASMQCQMNLLSHEKEELQSTLEKQFRQIEHLKEEVEEQIRDKQEYENMKSELFELELGLENIIQKLGGNDLVGDQKSAGVRGLLAVLEKLVLAVILESENSISKAQELGAKLLGSQKVVDELSTKVKLLEDSNQGRSASTDVAQERSIFEAPSLPSRSEITEIEDVGPLGKKAVAPVPSAAHVRPLRKGSNDHLAITIDSESDRLIKNEETDEDKGHIFKSLNTSGLVPTQGKMIADRIDGVWVSGGRALMSRPRARLGLVAYWLFLHIWVLGTILR